MQTMILTPFFKVDSIGERKSGNIRVVDSVDDKIIWKKEGWKKLLLRFNKTNSEKKQFDKWWDATNYLKKSKVERNSYSVLINFYQKNSNLKNDGTQKFSEKKTKVERNS